MKVCDKCIEISLIDLRSSLDKMRRGLRTPDRTIKCPKCGLWWEQRHVSTIQFSFNKRINKWKRTNIWFGEPIYIPMKCTQRRCMAQARHKVKTKGKRKYKCDRHAGVCIII